MSLEPILLLLLVLVPLVEWVVRRARDAAARRNLPPLPTPGAPGVPPGRREASLPREAPPAAPGTQPAAPPAQRRRRPSREGTPAPLRARTTAAPGRGHELRRAVVLMTVLGPCRAVAPYGAQDVGAH